MRKWGAFAAFGGLLLVLMVYVMVCEDRIERHEEVSTETISGIVTDALGEAPTEGRWSGGSLFAFDGSSYGEGESGFVDRALDSSAFPVLSAEQAEVIQSWLAPTMDNVELLAGPNVRARMALARSEASAESYESAIDLVQGLSDKTSEALATAISVEHWKDSQTGRLVFLDAVSASIEHDGWDQESILEISASLTGASHREALARVLHIRFVKDVQPKIVEASTESIIPRIAASGIYEEPEDEEDEEGQDLDTELIGKLLHRHTHVFDPEDTARSGAEDLSDLKAALQGPWADSQNVLDAVNDVHQIWDEYLDVMQMSDEDAVGAIASLELKLKELENAAGIALLHRERTSWSSLVQSAYVADAKEALLMIKLLTMAGREEEARQVIDPLTGEPFDFSNGVPSSNLTGTGDDYSFIKAFVDEGQGP